jgi:GT2 family glycosyltransferase
MSFCILIPTINRKDLLIEALEWYSINLPNVDKIVLDNGKQNIDNQYLKTTIHEADENLGVSGSWNFLIKQAISNNHTNFLVLNDDVILQKDEDSLNSIIQNNANNDFNVCQPHCNWSSFILNKHIYDLVGEFDEGFKKCYFEDNDYAYRMSLEGINIIHNRILNPDVYRNSMTIQKEPFLNNYIDNREYYMSKWGGLPLAESYKTPFNK